LIENVLLEHVIEFANSYFWSGICSAESRMQSIWPAKLSPGD